jgi:hypothetical protein
MSNEFAIHTTISMNDFYEIKSILEGIVRNGSDDINEMKTVIQLIDKIESLITEFEKEN